MSVTSAARSMNGARLASGVAIVAYAAATFAGLWTSGLTFVAVLFVLPLLAGFAIGRWPAVALVLWLFLAIRVVDGLEPFQEPDNEGVGGAGGLAVISVCIHIPLLLAGVGLRKLIRPRPPAEPWTTRLI
jgi:hypothetical protein